MSQPRSGRPHMPTERDRKVCKNRQSSVATLTTKFQTASNVNTRTVRRELNEMGFHGRAAAHKPKITMHNAKHRLECCKAHLHWTLEQWKHDLWSDEITLHHLAVQWTNLGLVDARRTLPVRLHSAN